MQIWRGAAQTPAGWGRCIATIGVFDGVHRGHQKIIGHVVKLAAEQGIASLVVTFDPHPAEVVRPGSHPPILTPPERKAELIVELGVDGLCILPFTFELSQVSAEQFVHDQLVQQFHVAGVVVGENFRFGNRARGDVALLRELGPRFGFSVYGEELLGHAAADLDQQLSSTYVRACVAAGDVARAALALGRPHRIAGLVVRGDGRGHDLGFPTANLETPQWTAIPGDGIYAAWLRLDGQGEPLAAAVSIGSNPTFAGTQHRVEAFALDYDGDLYGRHVALDFVERLRDMEHFATPDELVTQIDADVAAVRRLLS